MKLLISRKKKNIAFTLVLYYHSSSTSAESDHESATGASASANTRGQRRFVFSAKKSSQRGDFQQHPCKEIFFASQMKCWLHDCCIFYFIVQQKIKHSYISYYYFAIQYLRGSSYFKDIPNPCLLFTFCFLNIKIFTA